MLTLYSYPSLFGLADNNGYGLKVFACLRLAGIPFVHEHLFDASAAPRGQLPYIVDDGESIGDSDTIIAHLAARHGVALDALLDAQQRKLNLGQQIKQATSARQVNRKYGIAAYGTPKRQLDMQR